jgi:xanthine dehydrogenase YagR molybdenum-binding subunit
MSAAPTTRSVGTPLDRVDGRDKVQGRATYAYEHDIEGVAYAWIVQSTIAKGAITRIDTATARELPGVIDVVSHENAPPLTPVEDGELHVFQSPDVPYRGRPVAAVVAESLEQARDAAQSLAIEYATAEHDVELVHDHPKLYTPEKVNPRYPAVSDQGDVDAALRDAAHAVDVTYETPAEHNSPMEPHATIARWNDDGSLTLYDSSQGVSRAHDSLAEVLGLEPDQLRIVSPHVGGGFGSKGTPRPNAVIAALAAKLAGRPVKLAATRQQLFAFVGYRTPTIQHMRLGADAEGRLVAIDHQVEEQTSTLKEFAEQTATCTRMMYATPNLRTGHRVAALDVPTPAWMRAPGETPGMYALESALDELAVAAGVDPVELRIANDPELDPESGEPFTSRNLVACLRDGAERFGWAGRDPTPGERRDGEWLIGTGVASAVYPARRIASSAWAMRNDDDTFTIGIGAADIGQGARTVLTQVAADALDVAPERVTVELGDSDLPYAMIAGGSMGTTSWLSVIVKACEQLRREDPGPGTRVEANTAEEVKRDGQKPRYAFGAHFVEVHVSAVTGETRIPRMTSVFAAGRIINPKLARSQLLGGMTMGISMALHEDGVLDREFGDYLNHDFAQYHVASIADVRDLEAHTLDEHDDDLNPLGAKGIGEIGIVGVAAAVGNAVFHATGTRIRTLPITPDKLLATRGQV